MECLLQPKCLRDYIESICHSYVAQVCDPEVLVAIVDLVEVTWVIKFLDHPAHEAHVV